MENITKTKVGKIVAQDFRTARVFSAFGIDFCCKGGISLEEACQNRNLSLDEVLPELLEAVNLPEEMDYQGMELPALIDHILSVHHKYVESTIPVLSGYLEKLCTVHGERHPELHEIRSMFMDAAGALSMHMKKEELILFPFILNMCHARKNNLPIERPHFGHIENPIAMMEDEHETEGVRFRKIAGISNQYTPPADGCQTYRVAFAMLQEFEQDLHKHIHLENNILHPKARQMYAELAPVS